MSMKYLLDNKHCYSLFILFDASIKLIYMINIGSVNGETSQLRLGKSVSSMIHI